MLTPAIRRFTLPSILLLCALSMDVLAQAPPGASHGTLVSGLVDLIQNSKVPDTILKSATYLFWSLATFGLIWSMAILLFRRADFGELFLELIRFIVVTGIFYWLLIEASSPTGFVYDIVKSFKQMSGGAGDLRAPADDIIKMGLDIFYRVLQQSVNWKDSDILVISGISIIIVVALTFVAAQIALILIMAWMLAYGGIFLLGFGGSRWTSPVAINYYKHVIAVGISLLALILLMAVGGGYLHSLADGLTGSAALNYLALSDMLVVAVLMAILAIKLPSLLYSLVTGSPLGLLSGTASMAGAAMMMGGSSAITSATGAFGHRSETRREERYPSAVDAFYQVSSKFNDVDAVYQPRNYGDYGQSVNTRDGAPIVGGNGGSVFSNGIAGTAWHSSIKPHQTAASGSDASAPPVSVADKAPAPLDAQQPGVVHGHSVSSADTLAGQASNVSSTHQQPIGMADGKVDMKPESVLSATSTAVKAPDLSSMSAMPVNPSVLGGTASTEKLSFTPQLSTTPVEGFQPAALSNTSRMSPAIDAMPSAASGSFRAANLTMPNSVGAPVSTEGSPVAHATQRSEEATETVSRRIKQKVMEQRETSTDPGFIGNNHRVEGQPSVATPDEVASFRDRQLPVDETDPKGE